MNEIDTQDMLKADDIHTYYGKSHIIQGASLNIKPHECVALMGRNGAGKTTTLRSIIGLTPPKLGSIHFKGKAIHHLRPYEIARMGIGFVPEDRQIFATLTTEENLRIGLQKNRCDGGWCLEKVYEVFPRLAERRKNRGNQLSGGEQQMLTIARALMSNPELLLLDEPTEGLAPLIVEVLLGIIQSIKKAGLTILLVEQDVEATRHVADRYYILQGGQVLLHCDNREFWDHPEIAEKYLGV